MPAFHARAGMPFWLELVSSDIRRSARFYSELLDWEIAEQPDGTRLARAQGMPVAGFTPLPEEAGASDSWVMHLLAQDLDAQVERVPELGGRVLTPPTQVGAGVTAIVADPSGALVGLVDPAEEESFFAAGEPGTMVWVELTAVAGVPEALRFYSELLDWALTEEDGGAYVLAANDGGVFAGIRDARGALPPEVPSFWLPFLGVGNVDRAASLVAELGGTVVEGPMDSDFGRLLFIQDSTGAALMLCEAQAPVPEEAVDEGEDVLRLLDDAGLQPDADRG